MDGLGRTCQSALLSGFAIMDLSSIDIGGKCLKFPEATRIGY